MFVLTPTIVSAQVVISEVMYNPAGDNTKRQWAELLNTGSNVVTMTAGTKGWKINDGSNHLLVDPASGTGHGSLTLGPGEYAVLANDPATFTEEYPGGSYSVIKAALSPSASAGTITILDDSGTTVDSVSYTSDMGGNNDGNSLQRNANAWIAAAPTPGSEASVGTMSAGSDASTTPAQPDASPSPAPGASGPVSSASVPIEPRIFAYAGKDRDAIAGADTIFEARAVNKKGESITPGRFLWTFGDGASAEGQTVMHHFAAPGRYAVVLDIADGLYATMHQIIVTVLPVSIKLSVGSDRIVLANTSPKNLDLSYWSLRAGGKFFILPKHTVILGNASVPFTNEVTLLVSSNDAALLYPNGAVAADLSVHPDAARTPLAPAPAPAPARGSAAESNDAAGVPAASDSAQAAAAALAGEALAGEGNTTSGGSYLWWLGAAALALAGAGAVIAARQAGKREWNIIEETAE